MSKIKTIDSKPLDVDRYITLNVKKELDKNIVKKWFKCVGTYSPSGIIRTINIVDNKGKPTSVSLVHRIKIEGEHCYLIPLTRDLSSHEVEKIVKEFAEDEPDLDFDIETNEIKLLAKDCAAISLDTAKHIALCNALAKTKHEDWVRERTNAGWRYGVTFDVDEKTHPLIRPWDQLPDRYKEPDMDWPQKLVSLLNDQGYAVIQKDELERLLNMLRGIV
jgi:hypothetical protein